MTIPVLPQAIDLAARRIAARAANDDGRFPLETYDDLHASGVLRLVIPKAYGGAGASLEDVLRAQEALGAADAAAALVNAMSINVLGRQRDEPSWPAPVFAEIAASIAAQGGGINNCVTENELGSISRGGLPRTRARKVDGGWRITGRKSFVTGAPHLRYFVTAALFDPTDEAPNGSVAFALVEGGSKGLTVHPDWDGALAMRGCGNASADYDDVFTPDRFVVDVEPLGAPGAPRLASKKNQPNGWTLSVAALYLGLARAAIDAAADYALTRRPTSLDKPICELPYIQHLIGEMEITLKGARAHVYETARRWTQEPASRGALGPDLAAAKHLATNAACHVTDLALRVAGGFSLRADLPLERYFRDARAGLFFPPQDDLALVGVARAVLASRAAAAATANVPTERSA